MILVVDGAKIGEGRLDATVPMAFSGDETADLGRDNAPAVTDDNSPQDSAFTGTVSWVRIDTGANRFPSAPIIDGSPPEALRSLPAQRAVASYHWRGRVVSSVRCCLVMSHSVEAHRDG